MRKILFFLAFALLSCNALFSQDDFYRPSNLKDRDNPFRIAAGVKVGGGLAMATDPTVVTTNYPTGYDIDFKNRFAFQVGAVANMHFGRRQDSSPGGTGWLGAQAEVLYGIRTIGTEKGTTLKMHCLEIPVLFQVYPIPALAIEVGPTFTKTLKCTPDQLQLDDIALNTGKLSGSDIMLTAGIAYKTPINLMVDFRYDIGLFTLAGNLESKVSSAMVSVAYLFNIGNKSN